MALEFTIGNLDLEDDNDPDSISGPDDSVGNSDGGDAPDTKTPVENLAESGVESNPLRVLDDEPTPPQRRPGAREKKADTEKRVAAETESRVRSEVEKENSGQDKAVNEAMAIVQMLNVAAGNAAVALSREEIQEQIEALWKIPDDQAALIAAPLAEVGLENLSPEVKLAIFAGAVYLPRIGVTLKMNREDS